MINQFLRSIFFDEKPDFYADTEKQIYEIRAQQTLSMVDLSMSIHRSLMAAQFQQTPAELKHCECKNCGAPYVKGYLKPWHIGYKDVRCKYCRSFLL